MGAMKTLSSNTRTLGYFRWLCDIVEADKTVEGYNFLLKDLHSIPFRYSIHRDVNRLSDAKDLRREFFGDLPDPEGGTVSVLELIIAIAQRCDDGSMDDSEDDQTAKWFWELINNLKLDVFTDEMYYELRGKYKILEIVNVFLDRKYKKNGEGGLFPLSQSVTNQRNVEIWYQMSAYLQEKYRY